MLTVSALRAGYGQSQILQDVNLRVAPGEIVCLLGRNGVGKSTTCKSIIGLVRARAGEISFAGRGIAGLAPHDIARAGIGYVPEERLIFPDLTVAENLSMGLWQGMRRSGAQAFAHVLEVFPRLAQKLKQRGRTLSGGEQQMLAIGRAMISGPKLLLVDEPTEGLAPVIVQALEAALKDLAATGTALLVVESKLAVAKRIADRITVMAKGQTVFDGSAAELESRSDIRRQYLEV